MPIVPSVNIPMGPRYQRPQFVKPEQKQEFHTAQETTTAGRWILTQNETGKMKAILVQNQAASASAAPNNASTAVAGSSGSTNASPGSNPKAPSFIPRSASQASGPSQHVPQATGQSQSGQFSGLSRSRLSAQSAAFTPGSSRPQSIGNIPGPSSTQNPSEQRGHSQYCQSCSSNLERNSRAPILGSGFPVHTKNEELLSKLGRDPQNATEPIIYKKAYDEVLKLAKEYYISIYAHTTPVQVVEELGKKMNKLKEDREKFLSSYYKYQARGGEYFDETLRLNRENTRLEEENQSLKEENKRLMAKLRALEESSTPDTSPEPPKPLELKESEDLTVDLFDRKQKGKSKEPF